MFRKKTERSNIICSIQAVKEMAWSDNEITYKPKKVYTFVESLSSGDPNDTITTLHPGSVAAMKWGDVPYLFTTATVDEFLFSGWAYHLISTIAVHLESQPSKEFSRNLLSKLN